MLFDWQMGKWRCRPKKVYKFLWEIFVAAHKKKASKVVDDSQGNFLFIPKRSFFYSFGWSFGRSSVGELRELWILASVASTTTTCSTNSWSTTTRSTPQGGGYFISLFIDISKYWKEKGQFFASEFPPSPSWASCLRHEIKCFLHRFVTPEDLLTCHLYKCTSLETLPGHLSFLDLAVSLW